MKLLFIIDNVEPYQTAGGYYCIFKYAEYLARRGHEVHVHAVNELESVENNPSFKTHYRPHLRIRSRLSRKLDTLLSFLHYAFPLRRAVKRTRPDWILGVFTYSAVKAAKLGGRYGIRIANFVYETPPWLEEIFGKPPDGHRPSRKEKYMQRLVERTRKAYLASHVLFPISDLSRRYCSQWLEGKPVAGPIYPGIDPDSMPFEPPGPPARPHEAARREKILYVGRLSANKNVDVIIKAFLGMRRPAELHIVGKGEEERALMKLAGTDDRILFHGFVEDPELWDHYRTCDLVVFPSSFEGFGMPPMQALYFGKCCIVSDLPVFRSIFMEHVEYVPPRDHQALCRLMDELLDDPEYRIRRGSAGREFALSTFSWERSARLIEEELESSSDRIE